MYTLYCKSKCMYILVTRYNMLFQWRDTAEVCRLANVRVEWNIGECVSQGRQVGDSYIGWTSTVRVIVEELDVEDVDEAVV